ncbi:hypothetical protein RI570_21315 [Brucella pseudogrignonensis]|uniref:hypothetical protein n=1 Tax=Brucella pseudogrignonensis TaxID=419475 RepID=UPI0028B6E1BC|nr:hypothetical protein [Brucella pseudogrignonensis]MDT6940785.1 hypothetical protein [Brucella pseudogrignonensis]MDT6942592.1 hypothetical protein [Brucella pseudogrignonensis]
MANEQGLIVKHDISNEGIADALEKCDWAGASIGNKAILQLAIQALRNTRPAAPVEGLERYDLEDRSHFNEGSYMHPDETGEYVRFDQAEAIIAAERVEKEQLKAELAEALRGNRYAQLERMAVKRAEKAEADNAALTARVKELDHDLNGAKGNAKNAMSNVDYWRGQTEALETELAAAEGTLTSIAHTFSENSHGSMKSLSGSFYQSMANRYFAEKAKP